MDKIKYEEWLKTIIVIIDTREKKIGHVIDAFDELGVKYDIKKLDYGDYSYIDENGEPGNVIIERKQNINELAGNFGVNRERFKREWERTPKTIYKHLVVEGGSLCDIMTGNYKSKINSNSFLASLLTFKIKYDIHFHFLGGSYIFADYILKLFYYNHFYSII